MAYTPDPTNSSQPTDDVKASTAAAEFRALKAYLASAILGAAPLYPNYASGFTLSTAGGSATVAVAAGTGTNSNNTVLMSYAGGSKTTAAWAVGTGVGGLDTGAIANNTWYHVYIIRRPDTGVVDSIFSLSAAAPTLPANYTQYRAVGSIRTDGSAQWRKFYQRGNRFLWDDPINDVTAFTGTTAVTSRVLSTPLGVRVDALISVGGIPGAASNGLAYIFSPDVNSGGALAAVANGNVGSSGAAASGWSQLEIGTNVASQVSFSLGAATTVLYINTHGWTDLRAALN